LTDSPIYQLTD